MTTEPVRLLSATVVEKLSTTIDENLDRYRAGDFSDMAQSNGWAIESELVSWDPTIAADLDPAGTPEAEIQNSLLVHGAFSAMTPAMAREERLWARLCHVECLEFARARWLRNDATDANMARIHFFATGVTGCRDDNALGRLWWNGHVASLASPDDPELGLRRLLARANNRMQIIERANTGFREPLVRGLVRLLGEEPWFAEDDKAIVLVMKEVNKRSGGFVFEALDDEHIDDHLRRCVEFARG